MATLKKLKTWTFLAKNNRAHFNVVDVVSDPAENSHGNIWYNLFLVKFTMFNHENTIL
jgi:hypothetical protein